MLPLEGMSVEPPDAILQPEGSTTATYTRNVMIIGVRLMVFAAIGVLLPSFLTHRLSTTVYGAWILILQLASYIGYLDLGAQTGVSKYISEYTAKGDVEASSRHASAGMAITIAGGAVGLLASVALAWMVPVLFRGMPAELAKDVSQGVLLVGISTAVLLATSAIGGMFLGLQRYSIPVGLSVLNKTVYAIVLVVMVFQHRSLTVMGASVAGANVITAAAQVLVWKKMIPQIRLRATLVVWPILKRMLMYCAVLGVWTSGMILISGLDTTIVGHYRFGEVAFYAVAAVPIVFLNQLVMAALGPLMPATSAMSVTRTPEQMGAVLERTTRYTMLIQWVVGLPLLLFGYKALLLWVGPEYARHSLLLLRMLLVANVIRNVCLPYGGMVLGQGLQRYATLSGVVEAVVNLACSVVLGKIYGAIGVAAGTLIGSFVGVLFHFVFSMNKTQGAFEVSPGVLLRRAVLWPSLMALPTLVLLPVFWKPVSVAYAVPMGLVWAVVTLGIAWTMGLKPEERAGLMRRVGV